MKIIGEITSLFSGVKKYWIIARIILFIGLIFSVWILIKSNKRLSEKVQTSQNNVSVLLSQSKQYKTSDSLHAAQTYALTLKLKDFERFKAQDDSIINTLDLKGRKLQSVISLNNTANINLKSALKDSVRKYIKIIEKNGIRKDSIIRDTLKCFDLNTKYYAISACVSKDSMEGKIIIPEWIKLVISAKYKRFLGFLWYTGKIKDIRIDAVSKNPYINIMEVDYTTIEK